MKIVNPLSPKGKKEHISAVLHAMAGQGGCDGEPYDQMQMAADYILELEAKIELTVKVIRDLHSILSPYLEERK
jgi:hypothetical protein